METPIAIRAERAEDAPVISELVKRAYADVAYSDHREHVMIERLRRTDAFVRALSLLAEVHDQAVGHILLTRAKIRSRDAIAATLALAPLSVVPEYRRLDVGRKLTQAAHEQAVALGFGSIMLVGIPAYCPQFGYVPLSRYQITLPFEAPDENCMILPLKARALDGVTGMVEYPEGWLDH